jgi:hypothetical protein
VLGRWGPNHAADPIVTRWKRDNAAQQIVRDAETGRGILEFVSIERKDNGGWAIPGVCVTITFTYKLRSGKIDIGTGDGGTALVQNKFLLN